MKKQSPSLAFCIIMDALGFVTYAIPGLGELGDIVFAPLSAIIFYATFGSWKGALFNFTEEIIPGTDFIPTFTIMWVMQYFASRKTSTGIRTI
ncbi:MAG: hypothetical protein ABIU63_11885 [Chitinophagaceae bacterium]